MTQRPQSEPRDQMEGVACAGCGTALGDRMAFNLGGVPRCLRCTLTYPPLVRRSFYTAIVVGSVLVLINQGNVILGGDTSAQLVWKIPLTYAVPFLVATWGALINNRIRIP